MDTKGGWELVAHQSYHRNNGDPPNTMTGGLKMHERRATDLARHSMEGWRTNTIPHWYMRPMSKVESVRICSAILGE